MPVHRSARPRLRPLLLALVLAAIAASSPALTLAAARKLNATLALGGRIQPVSQAPLRPGYQISPDNSTVVFLADQTTGGVFELYSAPIGGGAPVRLNGPLAPGGNVIEFAIDTSSARVVYLADQREDETSELFSVPLGGGTPVTLNSFLTPSGDVKAFALSPDGSAAVFLADRNDDEVFDLFTAPIAGGAPDVRLNSRTSSSGDVQPDFAITGDNQRVIFRYDPVASGLFGIFSAPLTGGAPADDITAGQAGTPGSSVSVADFVITPNDARVVFRYSFPGSIGFKLGLSPTTGPIFFLNVIAFFGNDLSVELPDSSEVADGREGIDPLPYAVTADSAFVIFVADGSADGRYELWRAPVNDGPGFIVPTSLTPGLGANADVASFALNSTTDRVVYKADAFADNRYSLSSVRVNGSDTTLLAVPADAQGDVFRFSISPDASRVVFRSDFSTDESFELRSVPIDGSAASLRLNGPLAPGGGVARFAVTPNSQRVIYTADQDVNGVRELYSVLLAGGTPTRLNASLVNGGDVEDFAISPDDANSRVIFRADLVTDEVFALVSVPTAGGPGVTLSNTASIGGDVAEHHVAPNGSHSVFLADQETDEVFELFSRALGGSGGPVKLNADLGADGDVSQFQIDPTSQRVVYRADQDTDDVQELYSVSIGGGAVTRLNPPLVADGNITDFQISPDGLRVVYFADQATNDQFDLYSVPITGGAAVRLSSLAFRSLVGEFAISPNNQRVVYIADQIGNGVNELYSVAITGGSPTRLNGLLPTGGAIGSFEISNDSARVAYIGDQNTDDVIELYSVPLTGGALARLNPPLLPGRSVQLGTYCIGQRNQWEQEHGFYSPFLISPNSQRVVYCADQDADNVGELYSVPLNGSSAAVKLNIPPGTGGSVGAFEISTDSARVVFETLTTVASVPQERLYSAPLGGGSQPTLLNGPLVRPNSSIEQFAISLDSGMVAFAGDSTTADVQELFATPISGGTPSLRSGTLVTGGDVHNFRLSADSTRVVYRADALSDGVTELFANLLIGDLAPVVISDPLVTNGEVQYDFALRRSNDGAVYRADQLIDNVDELFETRFDIAPPDAVRVAFIGDVAVDEDGSATMLSVRLDRAASVPVTVSFGVTGGTASGAGVDFSVQPGTLSFAPGETTKTIPVTIIDDQLVEGNETIIVTLAAPSGAIMGSKPSGTVTIRDNEGAAGGPNAVYLPLLRR